MHPQLCSICPAIRRLWWLHLFLAAFIIQSGAAEKAKAPAQGGLTPDLLSLQGVWKLDEEQDNPVEMARLVVHGTFFLLIYQFQDREARVIEIIGVKTGEDDRLRNAQGEPVLAYALDPGGSLSLEILDEGADPASQSTEIVLRRYGRLPDLKVRP